jgi:hypothetical protein
MEYKTVEDLRDVANVRMCERQPMSRKERLLRWAELLERNPERRLRSLGEIELKAPADRPAMRAPDSPLSVAFEDPVLRAEGLAGDRLGDGMAFFSISEDDAHRLMCSCMNGWSMASGKAARTVRRIADPTLRLDPVMTFALGAVAFVGTLALLLA